MRVDPQLALTAALTTGIGYTMLSAGLEKHALERKRRRRTCPACGHDIVGRTCDKH